MRVVSRQFPFTLLIRTARGSAYPVLLCKLALHSTAVTMCLNVHSWFTGLPAFRSRISLSFLSLKQKELELMVFWQTATNVNMETWTLLNLPFIFETQILSLSQSAEQCLFLSCKAALPAFPSLHYGIFQLLRKVQNHVQTLDCLF